jgi:hypothetical protein
VRCVVVERVFMELASFGKEQKVCRLVEPMGCTLLPVVHCCQGMGRFVTVAGRWLFAGLLKAVKH